MEPDVSGEADPTDRGRAPAGGGDVIVRPIAQRLSESTGQQFVIDNRPGAGSIIAAQLALAAPPDGYTLLLATASRFSIAPFLARKRPYDPAQDFTPVTLLATAPTDGYRPSVAAGEDGEGARSRLARAKPRQLLYASNGTGSFSHLTTEMFSRAAGMTMMHVPYKGGTPAVIDTVSGNVQLRDHRAADSDRAGQSRAAARARGDRSTRSSALPELPTVAESGLPGFESVQWYALFAPEEYAGRDRGEAPRRVRKAAENPAVKAPLAQEGAELAVTGPQALARVSSRRRGEVAEGHTRNEHRSGIRRRVRWNVSGLGGRVLARPQRPRRRDGAASPKRSRKANSAAPTAGRRSTGTSCCTSETSPGTQTPPTDADGPPVVEQLTFGEETPDRADLPPARQSRRERPGRRDAMVVSQVDRSGRAEPAVLAGAQRAAAVSDRQATGSATASSRATSCS